MHLDGQGVRQERKRGRGQIKITDKNKTCPSTDPLGQNFSRGEWGKWDKREKKEMGGQREKERAYGERSG